MSHARRGVEGTLLRKVKRYYNQHVTVLDSHYHDLDFMFAIVIN